LALHGEEFTLGGGDRDVFEALIERGLKSVFDGCVMGVGGVVEVREGVLVNGCPAGVVFGDVGVGVNTPVGFVFGGGRAHLWIVWKWDEREECALLVTGSVLWWNFYI
jgi:hypothetical protein